MMRFLSLIFALGMLAALITALALEAGGVVTVVTETPAGANRETRVWFVEHEDRLYLEAGHPDNPWVKDLAGNPTLILKGQALDGEYRYMRHDSAREHTRIRALMREKYGWRDAWISLVFDTSRSSLLHLIPLEET